MRAQRHMHTQTTLPLVINEGKELELKTERNGVNSAERYKTTGEGKNQAAAGTSTLSLYGGQRRLFQCSSAKQQFPLTRVSLCSVR